MRGAMLRALSRCVLIAVCFILLDALKIPIQAGDVGDWKFFKPISISNPGDSLTDSQVAIVLEDPNFPVRATADGSDIRFADADGNRLDYWIEYWNFSDQTARIWVRVPLLTSGAEIVIRMYYGNPTAAPESDGEAVFILFDDFPGVALNPEKWAVRIDNPENTITVHDGWVDMYQGLNHGWFSFHGASYNLPLQHLKLLARSRLSSLNLLEDYCVHLINPFWGAVGFWARKLLYDDFRAITRNPAIPNDRWGNTFNDPTGFPIDTQFHRLELHQSPTMQTFFIDGELRAQTYDQIPPPYKPFFYFDHLVDYNHMYIDYVAVAQGSPAEPVIRVGGEELANVLPPATTAALSPLPNSSGWNTTAVSVSFAAVDNEGGVACIHYAVNGGDAVVVLGATAQASAANEGETRIDFFAVDLAGNQEPLQTITVRIDRSAPTVSGLPAAQTILWPPNNKLVKVAKVSAGDGISGLASFLVLGESNEPQNPADPDVVILGSGTETRTVYLRAARKGNGNGRVYTLTAEAIDLAGNSTVRTTTIIVPHDKGKK